jgi:hypothetical protein
MRIGFRRELVSRDFNDLAVAPDDQRHARPAVLFDGLRERLSERPVGALGNRKLFDVLLTRTLRDRRSSNLTVPLVIRDVETAMFLGPPCSRTLTFFYKELETRGEETPDKQCARFTASFATPRLRQGAAPE